MPRLEEVKIGDVFLADTNPDLRTTTLTPVEVIEKINTFVRCRTIRMPGDYGMSQSYSVSFYPDEFRSRFNDIGELKRWVYRCNPYAEKCFCSINPLYRENIRIQEEELKQIAIRRGEFYE